MTNYVITSLPAYTQTRLAPRYQHSAGFIRGGPFRKIHTKRTAGIQPQYWQKLGLDIRFPKGIPDNSILKINTQRGHGNLISVTFSNTIELGAEIKIANILQEEKNSPGSRDR